MSAENILLKDNQELRERNAILTARIEELEALLKDMASKTHQSKALQDWYVAQPDPAFTIGHEMELD